MQFYIVNDANDDSDSTDIPVGNTSVKQLSYAVGFNLEFFDKDERIAISPTVPLHLKPNFMKVLRWMTTAGCPYIPLEDISQFCKENETFQTEDLEMFAIKVFEKYTTVKTVEGENDEPSIS